VSLCLYLYLCLCLCLDPKYPCPKLTNPILSFSHAGKEEYNSLRLLPRTICRYHLYYTNTSPNIILFFQFNRAMCANLIDGPLGLHIAAGLGRETDAGWVCQPGPLGPNTEPPHILFMYQPIWTVISNFLNEFCEFFSGDSPVPNFPSSNLYMHRCPS